MRAYAIILSLVITFLNLAELVADVDAVGAVVGRQADSQREWRAGNRCVVKVARFHAQPPLPIRAETKRHHSLIFTLKIHSSICIHGDNL